MGNLTPVMQTIFWFLVVFIVTMIAGLTLMVYRGIAETKRRTSQDREDYYNQMWIKEPGNPEWPLQLGLWNSHQMQLCSGEQRKEAAEKAFRYFQSWLSLRDDIEPTNDYSPMKYLAISAFEAGALEEARIYAQRLLKFADHNPQRSVGNSIHYGNLILGRLALRSGYVETAKAYLIEAGKTPGSPQLNSFGPRLALAKELLEIGERDVVLQYFALCARFWRCSWGNLQRWTKEVNQGKIPDFPGNLMM